MVSFSADTPVGNRTSAKRERARKRMAITRAEFTTEEAKANGNSWARFGDGFVAGAGEDGKAWVFGIGRIGGGALAKKERGAFRGFDGAGVEAVCTEADGVVWRDGFGGSRHGGRIAC